MNWMRSLWTHLWIPAPAFSSEPKCCDSSLPAARPSSEAHKHTHIYIYIWTVKPEVLLMCGSLTCRSLDSVTLLMSTGRGLKPWAPSMEHCRTHERSRVTRFSLSYTSLTQTRLFLTWLDREIRRVRLCSVDASLSLIRSMLQHHDTIVFRLSLIGQRYASLSWNTEACWEIHSWLWV